MKIQEFLANLEQIKQQTGGSDLMPLDVDGIGGEQGSDLLNPETQKGLQGALGQVDTEEDDIESLEGEEIEENAIQDAIMDEFKKRIKLYVQWGEPSGGLTYWMVDGLTASEKKSLKKYLKTFVFKGAPKGAGPGTMLTNEIRDAARFAESVGMKYKANSEQSKKNSRAKQNGWSKWTE